MSRRIKERSVAPKWNIIVPPTGFHNVANTLEENGMIYSDTPVGSDGLQYFEVTVKDLRNINLGIGLFQTRAGTKHAPHLSIKHSKIWWSDGPLQSFKTKYGTHHLRKINERFFSGDIIGCGARPDERIVFLTKNGTWLGDYSLDARSETRLALFLFPDTSKHSSSQPWFDLHISFEGCNAPFAAEGYFSRMIGARARHSVGHAPLPPEVLSAIICYVISGTSRTAQSLVARLRLVCRHWNTVLRPKPYADIIIRRSPHMHSLMQVIRDVPANTSSPGTYIHTMSLEAPQTERQFAEQIPALETILLLGLGTHAIHLTQLTGKWLDYTYKESPRAPLRVASKLPALLRNLRALHTLHLRDRTLHSCAQLFSVIHALPSLKDLTLGEVAIDRVGPVRTQHAAAATTRLQTFCWGGSTIVNQRAAMAAVAARLCTGNDSNASAVAEAVARAPWVTHCKEHWTAEYTYKANPGGEPDSPLNFFSSGLVLKWSIPPAEENSPTRARLHATLAFMSFESPTIQLALKDLDPHLHPHYPLTLTLKGRKLESEVPDLQARLTEIMPHAHRLGLITIEAASGNKQ